MKKIISFLMSTVIVTITLFILSANSSANSANLSEIYLSASNQQYIAGDIAIYRNGDVIYLPYSVTRAKLKEKITGTAEGGTIDYLTAHDSENEYALTGDEISVSFDGRQGETVKICILGDADFNGIVNAADARQTLRYAAKLDTLPLSEVLKAGCDFNANGIADASDARKILRISARLDSFELPSKEVAVGEEIVIKNLKTAGSGSYAWRYTVSDSEAFEVSQSIAPPENTEILLGTPYNQTFNFKALKTGEYNVHFELIQPWSEDVANSFDVIFVVKENIK